MILGPHGGDARHRLCPHVPRPLPTGSWRGNRGLPYFGAVDSPVPGLRQRIQGHPGEHHQVLQELFRELAPPLEMAARHALSRGLPPPGLRLALTYQMIYEQPLCRSRPKPWSSSARGSRTVVGKARFPGPTQLGQYPELGKKTAEPSPAPNWWRSPTPAMQFEAKELFQQALSGFSPVVRRDSGNRHMLLPREAAMISALHLFTRPTGPLKTALSAGSWAFLL